MELSFHHIAFFFARLARIWYVYDELSPHIVAQEALKQWQTSDEALTHLLHGKTLPHNVTYAACLLWATLKQDNTLSDVSVLRTLLTALPAPMQAEVFSCITHDNQERAALLLIHLASPVLEGLRQTAQHIASAWFTSPRHDDLAMQFYRILPAYGIAWPAVQLVMARASLARGQVAMAEQLLMDVVKQHEQDITADALWLLAL